MFSVETKRFLKDIQRAGWRLSLENITDLLQEMGNPHKRLRSVIIGGTNGKGSTAAILESICRDAGYRTGLYTSPNLLDVVERIRLNSIIIPADRFEFYLSQIGDAVYRIGCTYFETLTAVAFQYFCDENAEIAILEVGLGGRFDATNVADALVSIITEIDLDHTDYLGSRKAKIAKEKAGIIKPGGICISGSQDERINAILREVAQTRNAEFLELKQIGKYRAKSISEKGSRFDLTVENQRYPNLQIRLLGRHQLRNAALAAVAARILNRKGFEIESENIYRGLEMAVWNGRMQLLRTSPPIVLDVAHNPAAFRQLIRSLRLIFPAKRLIFVIGVLSDKDYRSIAKLVARVADHILTVSPESDRALSAEALAMEFARYTASVTVCERMTEISSKLLQHAAEDTVVCVCGSHVTVGDFIRLHQKSLDK